MHGVERRIVPQVRVEGSGSQTPPETSKPITLPQSPDQRDQESADPQLKTQPQLRDPRDAEHREP